MFLHNIFKGHVSTNTAEAREIEELARQGVCDIKPCCCGDCYPCPYERIAEARELVEAKRQEKPQILPGPNACGFRGCGPPPCPYPCHRSRGNEPLFQVKHT